MNADDKQLGRIVAMHGIAPAAMQRAVFVVILSFLFFLAMMFAFYIIQSLVYFLLASAFLVLYLITMFSWVVQRRHVVNVYENGIGYRSRTAVWSEIDQVDQTGAIHLTTGKPILVPAMVEGREQLLRLVRQKADAA